MEVNRLEIHRRVIEQRVTRMNQISLFYKIRPAVCVYEARLRALAGDLDQLDPGISTSSIQGSRPARSKDLDQLDPGISTSSIQGSRHGFASRPDGAGAGRGDATLAKPASSDATCLTARRACGASHAPALSEANVSGARGLGRLPRVTLNSRFSAYLNEPNFC